ncbi:MAG TPA: thioredoxin family protein, partial [Thermoanaerobaculia bacterium]|nr:thioredoxin family protein [Thermoanaerobaculia bacterium]
PACSRAAATVGGAAPDFSLTDLQGKVHHLGDYRGRVVVLEWINPNCPFSRRHAEEGTMSRLAAAHSDVVWLAVNSTRRGHGEFLTPEQHAAYDKQHGISYPVLYDSDGKVGHAYGASTTPDMFVIDEEGKLVYRGAIDDDPYGHAGKRTNYVDAALKAHAGGKPADPASTRPYGCSVKY